MKWSFLLFSSFLCLQAIAQYPATGNKARLGWQTTGDGLVYRGAIGDTATLDPSGINNAWMLLDTANGNLYAYRAKAWRLVSGGGGSVSDTLTGEVKGPLDSTYIDTVANIIFRLDSTAVGVGELKYNDTQGSIQQGLKGGNVTNVIGQQLHQRVLNKTGSPLAKGEAVYLQGSQGNRITVAKAIATIDSTSANTFGIVAESIADNQSGYVITEGLITNMNTNALTEGAAVYLSPTVAGELTTTKPQAPQHTVYIGVCVKQNAGSGELFVKIRNGQELDELHDVRIDSLASNASLYYNAAQGVWRDTTGAVLISDTSVFARDFQISGTANYLAKFTGSNAVGNSGVFESGGNVGIGTTTPRTPLDIRFSGSYPNYYTDTIARVEFNETGAGCCMDITGMYVKANGGGGQSNVGIIGEGGGVNYDKSIGIKGIAKHNDTQGPGIAYGVIGEVSASKLGSSGAIGATIAGYFKNTAKVDGTHYGVFVETDSSGDYGVYQTGFGANYFKGNVGIATSSPSRPLHVAGTTAIRIPVGTTSDRGTSANGDIRYNTTNANFEWYSGTGWREPVNAARSPNTVGLANRFSKFDANGLLDTSAVLVQANGRIGIGTASPAAGFVVDVTGGDMVINGMRLGKGPLNIVTNVAFGANTLSNVDTNTIANNIAIGATALNQMNFQSGKNTPEGNTAIGSSALAGLTFGQRNTAIGVAAMGSCKASQYNIAIGPQALFSDTTSISNTVIGLNAMYYSKNGSYNLALGTEALRNLQNSTTANTNYNVGIGFQAGFNISSGAELTTANQSIYIGSLTRALSNAVTNEIAIGYNTTGNGSNTTTIGNSSTTNTIIPAGSLTVDVMRRKAPVTVTGNHTVAASTSWLICDGAGTIVLTLPAASSWTGREIMVKTIQPQAVTSASSNVVPIDGVATGTAILPATDGAWCTLVSDGTNWIIMQRGS